MADDSAPVISSPGATTSALESRTITELIHSAEQFAHGGQKTRVVFPLTVKGETLTIELVPDDSVMPLGSDKVEAQAYGTESDEARVINFKGYILDGLRADSERDFATGTLALFPGSPSPIMIAGYLSYNQSYFNFDLEGDAFVVSELTADKVGSLMIDQDEIVSAAGEQALQNSVVAAFSPPPTPAPLETFFRVIKLATDADYEYTTQLGGAAQANARIQADVNAADSIYQRDLRIKLAIVYQRAWATNNDPYTSLEGNANLIALQQSMGTSTIGPAASWNVAHLFTGRNIYTAEAGYAVNGISYVGNSCVGAGLSERPSDQVQITLFAHELGHGLGAQHDTDCSNIMCLFASTQTVFSPVSRSAIGNHLDELSASSNGGCIQSVSGISDVPLPPTNLNFSQSSVLDFRLPIGGGMATGFDVFRSTDGTTCSGAPLLTHNHTNNRPFVDTSQNLAGQRYTYSIRSTGPGGTSVCSEPVVSYVSLNLATQIGDANSALSGSLINFGELGSYPLQPSGTILIPVSPGTYQMTPHRRGFQFSPRSQTVVAAPSLNPVIAVAPFAIQSAPLNVRVVSDRASAGVPGVVLNGGSLGMATTDAEGWASFSYVAPGSSYAISFLSVPPGYFLPSAPLTGTFNLGESLGYNLQMPVSLTGHVLEGATGVPGVTVSVQGQSRITDSLGAYSFENLTPGATTISVSAPGIGFASSVRSITLGYPSSSQDFQVAYVSVTGRATTQSGAAIGNVAIYYTGAVVGRTFSNSNGDFSIAGLPVGQTASILALKSGFSFSPAPLSVVGTSGVRADFRGAAVAGVSNLTVIAIANSREPVSGATVSVSGQPTVTTNASGMAVVPNLSVGQGYTISVSAPGFHFSPSSRVVNFTAGAVQEFSADAGPLRGRVLIGNSSVGLAGVSINGGPTLGSVLTDSQGAFVFNSVTYATSPAVVLTPTLSGYAFTPATYSVSFSSSSAETVIRTSGPNITGTVLASGRGVPNVTINIGALGQVVTDSSGHFAISSVRRGGTYSLSAARSGFAFSPAVISGTLINNANVQFTATQIPLEGHVYYSDSREPVIGLQVAGSLGSRITDSSGSFTYLNVPIGTSVTATPPGGNLSFYPASLTLTAAYNGEDYSPFDFSLTQSALFGAVTAEGLGIGGVEIDAGPLGRTFTGNDGRYRIALNSLPTNPVAYTVSAFKFGFQFSPSSLSGTTAADGAQNNFIAVAAPLEGAVVGNVQSLANILISSGPSSTALTDYSGTFSIPGVPIGRIVTVSALDPRYSLYPVNLTFTHHYNDYLEFSAGSLPSSSSASSTSSVSSSASSFVSDPSSSASSSSAPQSTSSSGGSQSSSSSSVISSSSEESSASSSEASSVDSSAATSASASSSSSVSSASSSVSTTESSASSSSLSLFNSSSMSSSSSQEGSSPSSSSVASSSSSQASVESSSSTSSDAFVSCQSQRIDATLSLFSETLSQLAKTNSALSALQRPAGLSKAEKRAIQKIVAASVSYVRGLQGGQAETLRDMNMCGQEINCRLLELQRLLGLVGSESLRYQQHLKKLVRQVGAVLSARRLRKVASVLAFQKGLMSRFPVEAAELERGC